MLVGCLTKCGMIISSFLCKDTAKYGNVAWRTCLDIR